MVPNVDEADNLARMERGELLCIHPQSCGSQTTLWRSSRPVQQGRRLDQARNSTALERVSGERLLLSFTLPSFEITNDDTPLPAPGASTEEDDQVLQSYPWIERPINIDYGTNIKFGVNVFINFNCTIIDTCLVSIGSRTMFGPNVSLYSGTHPLDPDLRDGTNGPEYGKPITIGDDC
ncbi:unnamed protein product [Colletotrichum noveboracense]|uniref:Mannose-1-phosphate guanylyltransferase n=1 Tax=Colletotrichum noveboracense TaxID=2664923 RepID=A0A9W4RY40_9PEZI|nr:unnamed protein product [Colletotrichum noveboracense]